MTDALACGQARVVGQLAERVFRQAQDAAFIELDFGMGRPAGPQPRGFEQRHVAQGRFPGLRGMDLGLDRPFDLAQPRVSGLRVETCGQQQPQGDRSH